MQACEVLTLLSRSAICFCCAFSKFAFPSQSCSEANLGLCAAVSGLGAAAYCRVRVHSETWKTSAAIPSDLSWEESHRFTPDRHAALQNLLMLRPNQCLSYA
eukprot:3409871-Rhodomonas_salina.1